MVSTTRCLWILLTVSDVRIMLSILGFGVLLLVAAVSQVIITLFGRRHAGNYCVANPRDTGVGGVCRRRQPALRHVVSDHIDTGAGTSND
jgi:hypothetical protein